MELPPRSGPIGGPSADDKMVTMACSKNDFFTLQTESSTTNENSEEESGFNGFPSGKRLAPVGANDEDAIEEKSNRLKMVEKNLSLVFDEDSDEMESGLKQRIKEMEEDQEELNSSLMALTSHFAKVQFRLQQVVCAPADKREDLLKDLEHFAFRGIPNLISPRLNDSTITTEIGESIHCKQNEVKNTKGSYDMLESQRRKQAELIYQLKGQLEELESYAYESGDGELPSRMILERQRIVMEQLKTRLNLRVDNIEKLTADELRAQVDSAVGEIVNPLKMKGQLVNQLQTQIQDLEMFIEFLQGEASTMVPTECHGCVCNKHNGSRSVQTHRNVPRYMTRTMSEREEIRQQTVTYLEKAMAVLQITSMAQFGCGADRFIRNSIKNTPQGNHYGDLRARLELAVGHVLESCSEVECMTDTDCTSILSDSDTQSEYLMSSPRVASIIRRELAIAIRDLIQHGLITTSRSSMMPLMGCMSSRNGANCPNTIHAWTIILKYYEMKQGREFNNAPARRLSQSFGLDLTGCGSSSKQSFFAAVGQILSAHEPYKRSNDAQFKAFVCIGLNEKKLITWLRLVLRNQTILERYYSPWSYVVKTGFEDALRVIDRLSIYAFDLPVNVSVQHFHELNEAF